MFDDSEVATVDDLSSFHVELRPHGGMALLVTRAPSPRPTTPDAGGALSCSTGEWDGRA